MRNDQYRNSGSSASSALRTSRSTVRFGKACSTPSASPPQTVSSGRVSCKWCRFPSRRSYGFFFGRSKNPSLEASQNPELADMCHDRGILHGPGPQHDAEGSERTRSLAECVPISSEYLQHFSYRTNVSSHHKSAPAGLRHAAAGKKEKRTKLKEFYKLLQQCERD